MNELSIKTNREIDIQEIRKEYESLRKRTLKTNEDIYFSFAITVHGILTAFVTLAVALTTHNTLAIVLTAIYYGGVLGIFVSFGLCVLVYKIFGPRFTNWNDKRRPTRRWYQRYEYLGKYIKQYEEDERTRREEEKARREAERLREVEEERLRLLPLHNAIQEISVRLREYETLARDLDDFFRQKKKWYSEYRPFEQNLDQCVERLNELEGEVPRLEERFADLSKESPTSIPYLRNSISRTEGKFKSLLEKMQSMKNWTPPIRTMATQSTVRAPTSTASQQPRISPSRPTIAESETLDKDYDYSLPTDIKQPTVVVPPSPPNRRVLNKQLKKIPFEDYVGAAKAKMTIGELGEVVVLHYEIRRVDEETGRYGTHRVRRVSEESDSFGYDIESFSQGEKVFIEVKSTSGPFWTDFFLTANERNVMKKLGEKYWLYRIFELSKDDGSAKLSVFRGCKEIEASFDLEAQTFKIKPKTDNIFNESLPFETLDQRGQK